MNTEKTNPQPNMREAAAPVRESRAPTLGASPIAGAQWRTWARNFAVAAAAGAFLALVGAMDTADLQLGLRLLYWVPLMLGGAALGHAVSALIGQLPRARGNVWLFGAALSIGIAIPTTFIVWLYSGLLFSTDFSFRPLFGGVLLISVAMTAIMVAINRPGAMTHAPVTAAATPEVRFLARLPPKLKGAVLYAVSAEDHYLRIHTSKGSDLILMRLADAIAELEGIEGAQTHRSWWVARAAIESANREGDRVTLRLKGDVQGLVSRPNARPLREAGWI
jgi:LytTr DNA-binding domain